MIDCLIHGFANSNIYNHTKVGVDDQVLDYLYGDLMFESIAILDIFIV